MIQNLKALQSKWEAQGVDLSAYEGDDISLLSIIVPRELRSQGVGSEAMQDLIQYADSVGKLIRLTPASRDAHHGTTSKARLVKFYKQFGFVENKGRNKDFRINADSMYRLPSGGLQEKYMTKFEKIWAELMEDNTAGSGGAFGDGGSIGGSYNPDGGPIGGADNYAPGDARMPKVLGAKEGKKKKKKKKQQGVDEPIEMKVQRRVFPNM